MNTVVLGDLTTSGFAAAVLALSGGMSSDHLTAALRIACTPGNLTSLHRQMAAQLESHTDGEGR